MNGAWVTRSRYRLNGVSFHIDGFKLPAGTLPGADLGLLRVHRAGDAPRFTS
jgi:hypothetical protein